MKQRITTLFFCSQKALDQGVFPRVGGFGSAVSSAVSKVSCPRGDPLIGRCLPAVVSCTRPLGEGEETASHSSGTESLSTCICGRRSGKDEKGLSFLGGDNEHESAKPAGRLRSLR